MKPTRNVSGDMM